MPMTIQIRDVPDEVHATYRARAAAAGKSLQQYLRDELAERARLQTPEEIMAEVAAERRARGDQGRSSVSSAELIRADREDR